MSIRKQQGFTLIELMVTLVVLGILIAVGLPSFKSQILTNKSTALNEDLMEALNFVRSEAVKQGQPGRAGASARFVTLCASSDGATCSSDTTKWGDGFIAIVDYATAENANPAKNPATSTYTVLRTWSSQDAKAAISIKHGANAGTPTSFIRYTSSGKLAARTTPPSAVVIRTKMKDKTDTDCVLNSGQKIEIGVVGMMRVVDKSCW